MARRTTWLVTVQKPRKNDGPYWMIRAKPPKGVTGAEGQPLKESRTSSGTYDRALAEKKAQAQALELNAQLPLKADPFFMEVYEQHLAFRKQDGQTSPGTVDSLICAQPYVLKGFENVRASSLTRAVVTRARDELAQQPTLAARTANLYMSCAARAWNWAYERELVHVTWPKVKKLKEAPVEKRPYRPEELQAVLDWLRDYREGLWLPFFSVLADSSCRISAVCQVRGEDVNRAANEIFIRHAKGGKSKTIAVTPETMALVPLREPGQFVFHALTDPSKPLNRRVVGHVLRRAIKALGIPDGDKLDLHSFRRSWVSYASRAAVPDTVGARQTGHADLRIYHSYQRNTAGDDLHEAVRKVAAYRGKRVSAEPKDGSPAPSPDPPQIGQNGAHECLLHHDLQACLASATRRSPGASSSRPARPAPPATTRPASSRPSAAPSTGAAAGWRHRPPPPRPPERGGSEPRASARRVGAPSGAGGERPARDPAGQDPLGAAVPGQLARGTTA